MLSVRNLGFLLGIAAFGLQAGDVQVFFGNSTLRRGTLRSTSVGSIQLRAHRDGLALPGRALLKDVAGRAFEVPCEVQTYALAGDQGETADWRVEVPEGTALRSLTVVRGSQVLARLESPRDLAPATMDFADSINGRDASIGWVLVRPSEFDASSLWLRWSWDEGSTWTTYPRVLHDEAGTGQLNLERLPDGTAGGTLLEFWVPQGLGLTRIRHRIAGRFRPV